MSVLERDAIDAVGIEGDTGKVILTISDHLDWTETSTHLEILGLAPVL